MRENQRDLYLMDETDAPYKEGEYERTATDDIVLLNIVKENNLELREGSRLYQLNQQLHIV